MTLSDVQGDGAADGDLSALGGFVLAALLQCCRYLEVYMNAEMVHGPCVDG